MTALQMATLNVSRGKHDQVWDFLKQRSVIDDLVLLQEIIEPHRVRLECMFEYRAFVPMTRVFEHGEWVVSGIGMYSHLPLQNLSSHYYVGDQGRMIQNLDDSTLERIDQTKNRMLLVGEVEKNNSVFWVGTTHFTWVPGAEASDFQRQNIRSLLAIVKQFESFVLGGDFNFPRTGEIYQSIKDVLVDWVPESIDNTLDPELHKLKGRVKVMIDYFFTKKGDGQKINDVGVTFGLSDHGALSGVVS